VIDLCLLRFWFLPSSDLQLLTLCDISLEAHFHVSRADLHWIRKWK
jgi:hypothetical protein